MKMAHIVDQECYKPNVSFLGACTSLCLEEKRFAPKAFLSAVSSHFNQRFHFNQPFYFNQRFHFNQHLNPHQFCF